MVPVGTVLLSQAEAVNDQTFMTIRVPFCQKVKVVLVEKDLEYEAVFVDLRQGQQKTPEFLKLNPVR
jgi:glutathione S-transferase